MKPLPAVNSRTVPLRLVIGLAAAAAALAGCGAEPEAKPPWPETVRFATFNIAMGREREGEQAEALQQGHDARLRQVAEILQRVRPHVVLLNEFDFEPGIDAAQWFNENYASVGENGAQPIHYAYAFSAPVNTGVPSGRDLDGNGRTGDPGDAFGFGHFPGQYGMLVLAQFPLDTDAARTFQHLRWADLPGAAPPLNADGTPWYPAETWQRLRLSSKSHWDLPLNIHGNSVHLLVLHPTPPVFDGPEDRNGRRNFDEIRLLELYLAQPDATWLVDDQGRSGGLDPVAAFVIAADLNADPLDGDSIPGAADQLLRHPRVDAGCVPASEGGVEAASLQGQKNLGQRGNPAHDTADFNDESTGNLRLDFVLPSRGLEVVDCGVFWPASGQPGHELVAVSDHRLVWLDIEFEVVK